MRLASRALCGAAGAAWRDSFPLGGRDVARWFPGHMAKGEGGGRAGVRPPPAPASVCPCVCPPESPESPPGATHPPAPAGVPSARSLVRLTARGAGGGGGRQRCPGAALSPSTSLLPLYFPKPPLPHLFLRRDAFLNIVLRTK